MILAVMDDLIFGVKLQDAARRAGRQIEFTSQADMAVAKSPGALVILDLNLRGLDTIALIGDLKAAGARIVAYVSHVQVELRRAAEAAGADQVLARSAFVTKIDELVRE